MTKTSWTTHKLRHNVKIFASDAILLVWTSFQHLAQKICLLALDTRLSGRPPAALLYTGGTSAEPREPLKLFPLLLLDFHGGLTRYSRSREDALGSCEEGSSWSKCSRKGEKSGGDILNQIPFSSLICGVRTGDLILRSARKFTLILIHSLERALFRGRGGFGIFRLWE